MPDPSSTDSNPNSAETPEFIAHYRIVRRLGKGRMGEVFLAEDTPGLVLVRVDPLFDDLRSDERFKQPYDVLNLSRESGN